MDTARTNQAYNVPKVIALLGLCILVYAPAFNNGFISDDYVILQRTELWSTDFSFHFRLFPEVFRVTTSFAFFVLKGLFGYEAPWFYAFSIVIHFFNCLMLWRLVVMVGAGADTGFLAALFFAAIQNPHEAVMWLASMNELLCGFFLLSTIITWVQRRFTWSSLCFLLALFSKESAVVGLPILFLVTRERNEPIPWKRLPYLIGPLLVFSGVFLANLRNNAMISHGLYSLDAQAPLVLLISLHKLAFPWLYLGFLLACFSTDRWKRATVFVKSFFSLSLLLLPYIFLTYQNHVPSRHEYLASSLAASLLAIFLAGLRRETLKKAFLVALLLGNIRYVWFRKDDRFEARAAPTAQLIEELKTVEPQPVLISDFPLNPWVAKTTTGLVPGWSPEHIILETQPEGQAKIRLRWDKEALVYKK